MSSTQRNICIIGPFPEDVSLIKGGVQASVYGMARSLKTHGSAVKVISLPLTGSSLLQTRPASVEGTDILYLGARRFAAQALFHIPLILRHLPASSQIVHIHGTGPVQAALIAMLRLRRSRHVWTLHGITEKETWQRYQGCQLCQTPVLYGTGTFFPAHRSAYYGGHALCG